MFDKDAINTIVKAAVIHALGEDTANKVLDNIVTRMLDTKVNKNGGTSYDSYGGHPDTPMLDYLVDREIKIVVQDAVRDYIKTKLPDITESVQNALITNEGLAKSISDIMTRQLSDGTMNINIDFKRHD